MAAVIANARSQDPTKTTNLRRRFEAELRRRFERVRKAIYESVVLQDDFGLKANQGRFEFARSSEKVSAFMSWLRSQQRREILDIQEGVPVESAANRAWTNKYVETAYQKGVADAGARLRGSGAEVSDRWVNQAFNRPIHADRLGLLYTRTFSELNGITEEMDRQISDVLTRGMAEGRGPMDIARSLIDRVNRVGIVRARTMARTEVINSHAEATLNSYTEAGVEGVEVEAEFTTAGDGRVCPECERLEDETYTIEQARSIIPVHPNCRCAWRPKVENGSGITLR